MSNCLINAEAALSVACRRSQSWLPREASSATQQCWRPSPIDRKLILAITTAPAAPVHAFLPIKTTLPRRPSRFLLAFGNQSRTFRHSHFQREDDRGPKTSDEDPADDDGGEEILTDKYDTGPSKNKKTFNNVVEIANFFDVAMHDLRQQQSLLRHERLHQEREKQADLSAFTKDRRHLEDDIISDREFVTHRPMEQTRDGIEPDSMDDILNYDENMSMSGIEEGQMYQPFSAPTEQHKPAPKPMDSTEGSACVSISDAWSGMESDVETNGRTLDLEERPRHPEPFIPFTERQETPPRFITANQSSLETTAEDEWDTIDQESSRSVQAVDLKPPSFGQQQAQDASDVFDGPFRQQRSLLELGESPELDVEKYQDEQEFRFRMIDPDAVTDNAAKDWFSRGFWTHREIIYLIQNLWKLFEKEAQGGPWVGRQVPILFPGRQQTFVFRLFRNPDGVWDAWYKHSPQVRLAKWKDVALTCCLRSTKSLLAFLTATHSELQYVPRVFTFCMLVLRRFRWDVIERDPNQQRMFDDLARWMVQKSIETRFVRSYWGGINLLQRYCNPAQLRSIFDIIMEKEVPMQPGEAFLFMSNFTREHDIDYALTAFREMAKDLEFLNRKETLIACSYLLRLDYVEQYGTSQNFRILSEMLAHGLEPDVVIHNIAIWNALRSQSPHVAWDIFNYMKENNLETTSYTYLALVTHCTNTEDSNRLTELLVDINAREDLSNNIYIIGNILECIRVMYSQSRFLSSSTAFDHMLHYYKSKLQLEPLQHILDLPMDIDPEYEATKLEPSSVILSAMLCAYLLTASTPTTAVAAWICFRDLVSNSDPIAISITEHPYIYSAFIQFFGTRNPTLPNVIEVLMFMLQQTHPAASPADADTFVLVIIILFRHNKPDQAFKVAQLMYERGIVDATEARGFKRESRGLWKNAQLDAKALIWSMQGVQEEVGDWDEFENEEKEGGEDEKEEDEEAVVTHSN